VFVRIQLSPETIDSLENLTGKKITRNGDEVVQQACDLASGNCNQKGKAWLEPDNSEKGEEDAGS